LIHFSEATRKDEIKSFEVDDLENKSTFCGYDTLEIETQVLRTQENMVVLAKTPFFGESGGQIGDRGKIFIQNKIIEIIDTQRKGNINIHFLRTLATDLKEDTCIKAQVDKERRLSIQRNHSATHLLHNALRRILGTHVHQAGSLVAPDYLRFDFAHFAKLSDQELADIESLVNEKIKENIPRTPGLNNIPFEEANKLGALMFFGDKYGDFVNVIQFGDFSIEFCGGTHVNNTGEIGYFKICEESSVASGTRRIVAVTGTYALDYLIKQKQEFEAGYNFAFNQLEEIFKSQIKDIKELPPIPNQASPELASYFTQLHKNKIILQKVIEQDNEEKKKREKEIAKSRLKSLSGSMDELIASAVTIGDIKLVAAKVSAASIDELKNLGDSLRSKLGSGVGLLACVIEDKVQLVCVVTDDLVAAKIIEAGKVVGSIAKIVGGGGGGRAHMATAGGKDVSKLDEALAQTKSVVESFLRK
jgi:alanyl-tRNA synthetase